VKKSYLYGVDSLFDGLAMEKAAVEAMGKLMDNVMEEVKMIVAEVEGTGFLNAMMGI